MVKRTRFVKYDIRQMIERIDPNNRKRQTMTYEWSNGKKFYKNELPGTSESIILLPLPLPPKPGDTVPFIVLSNQTFITSDVRDFKVQPI